MTHGSEPPHLNRAASPVEVPQRLERRSCYVTEEHAVSADILCFLNLTV